MKSTARASQPSHTPAAPAPRVLITAGPTQEPIDSVRYVGNRSSGRMGIALAQAALSRQWPVTLLLGPVAVNPPQHSHLNIHRFRTAADLQALLQRLWPTHDLLLMAAAVADYRLSKVNGQEPGGGKIKRRGERLMLELAATPDLLASLAPINRPDQTIVGFALEEQADLATGAMRKLRDKGLDAIVANPLETMDSPTVTASLLLRDGRSVAAPPGID
jgi:phosphopantothenoylcysteine decarboxylase/phosphopantothenate--cysteine ligase